MELQTLGHASILLRDDAKNPLLLTDPWLIGSCYWRSWWLQNYPGQLQMEEIQRTKYCYITHEHPDHFHTASIRKLNKQTKFLSPELPQENIAKFLKGNGLDAEFVKSFQWKEIHSNVKILSIPLFNDDSALLIDTPNAFIVNLNDSKPRTKQLWQLLKFMDKHCNGKNRILLSSYSPASIVNSFIRNAERVSMKGKKDYVDYISKNCQLMKIDFYMPFASQVIFKRSDSSWANEFKVSFDDLTRYWSAHSTKLLPPFSKLNLTDFLFDFIPEEKYNHNEAVMTPKVKMQEEMDAVAEFDTTDIEGLKKKLNRNRFFLCIFFSRGIGFVLEKVKLYYNPWSGKIRTGEAKGHFTLKIPARAFKDAIEFGHFGDLGITMFTMIILNGNIHPRRVYLFFIIMTFHDYGHTISFRNFLKWLKNTIQIQSWKIPPLSFSK